MNASETARPHSAGLEEGDTVIDVATGRIGRVLGPVDGKLRLRPVGSGDNWDAEPRNLTYATYADVERAWQERTQ